MVPLTRLVCVCLLGSQLVLGASDERALVRVEVWTMAREAVPDATIQLLDPVKRTRMNEKFRDGIAKGIPYGTYILRVERPGFRIHEQTIKVDQAEIAVRVVLLLARNMDNGALHTRSRYKGA
jgi:hypothetical protein